MKFYSLSRHLKFALFVLLIVANVQLGHAQFVIHPKSSAAQVTQKDARQFIFDADSARWTFAGRDVVDEFRMLIDSMPDAMAELIRIATISSSG